MTTNAYNNNEKRREGQDHDFMEYSFGELEKEEGPEGGCVGGLSREFSVIEFRDRRIIFTEEAISVQEQRRG